MCMIRKIPKKELWKKIHGQPRSQWGRHNAGKCIIYTSLLRIIIVNNSIKYYIVSEQNGIIMDFFGGKEADTGVGTKTG